MDHFRRLIVLFFISLFVVSPSFVMAVGITTPFFGDEVEMFANDRVIITFILQNMVGGEDLEATVDILEGSEIARVLDGPTIAIPYGRKDIPLNIELTTPANPLPSYVVDFMVKTSAPADRRQVQIATGLEKRFTVVVKDGVRPVTAQAVQSAPVPQPVLEQPMTLKTPQQNTLLAAVLVFVIYILYRIVKKHKQQGSGRDGSRSSL